MKNPGDFTKKSQGSCSYHGFTTGLPCHYHGITMQFSGFLHSFFAIPQGNMHYWPCHNCEVGLGAPSRRLHSSPQSPAACTPQGEGGTGWSVHGNDRVMHSAMHTQPGCALQHLQHTTTHAGQQLCYRSNPPSTVTVAKQAPTHMPLTCAAALAALHGRWPPAHHTGKGAQGGLCTVTTE